MWSRRRAIQLIARGVALAIALLAVVSVGVHTPPVRRYALALLVNAARDQAQIRLQASALDFNLFAATAELHDVVLTRTGSMDPFFRAARVRVDIALYQALRGAMIIEAASASQAAIRIFIDEQGNSNLPESSGDAGAGELPQFLIQRLTMDGSLQYEDQRSQFAAALPQWQLDVQGASIETSAHQIQLRSTAPGTLRYQERDLGVQRLEFAGDFNRNAARIGQLRVTVDGADLSASGSVTDFADPALDLQLIVDADTATLARFADADAGVSGGIHTEARIRNTVETLAVEADFATTDLAVREFNQLRTSGRILWTAQDQVVRLENATLNSPEAALRFEGTWSGSDAAATNFLTAQIDRVNLSLLSRKLQLPAEIASEVRGDVRAAWPGLEFADANALARLRITSLRDQAARNIVPLTGDLRIEARRGQIRLTTESLRALGTTIAGTVDIADRTGLAGNLTGSAGIAEAIGQVTAFQGTAPMEQDLAGQAQVQVTLGGTLSKPTASVIAEGTQLKSGPIEDASLQASAQYDGARIEVDRARIAWKGSEVNATGRIDIENSDQPFVFNAQVREVAIATVLAAVGQTSPLTGLFSMEADGQGTLTEPQVSISLRGRELAAYGEELGDLNAHSTFANQALDVDMLRLERASGGEIFGNGTYSLSTRDYAVRLQANSFAVRSLELPDAGALRGTIDLTLSGMGNVDDPSVDFDLKVADARAADLDLGLLGATGNLANQQVKAELTAPAFRLLAEVTAQAAAPYALSSTITISNLDLASLPLDQPLQGTVTAKVDASGEPQNWKDGAANVEVSDFRVRASGAEFGNRAPLRLTIKERMLEIQSAQLTGPGSEFTIQGRMPLDQSGPEGLLTYDGTLDLAAMSALAGEQRTFDATGSARLAGEIRGSLEKISPTGTIRLTGGTVTSTALAVPVTDVTLEALLSRGAIDIQQLSAKLGTGTMSAQGSIPLGLISLPEQIDVDRAPGLAQFHMEAQQLELSTIAELPATVAGGAVSVTVDATAAKPELDSVEATITFNQLQVALQDTVVTAEAPPRFTLRNGAMHIEDMALRAAGSSIRVTGSALLAERSLQDVQLAGSVDAGRLGELSPGMRATGVLNFQVRANGAWDEPSVDGFAEMAGGRVTLREPRLDANELNLRLNLLGRRVEIEKFEGTLNGGTFSVAGGADVGDAIRPDLTLTASEVYLELPAGLRSQSDVNLALKPQGEFLELSGDVTIAQSAYTRQFEEQLLTFFQSSRGIELAEERNPQLEKLRFNVAIKTEEPLVINNNVARLGLSAQLRLLGTYYRPGLAGRVDVEEGGTLHLQERDYLVEQGSITFANETRIEPLVDLSAQTRVDTRNITLNVNSGQDGIETTFTSDDPNDTRADIISLLLTGRTTEELEGKELNVAGEQAALSLLAGSLSGRVSRQLEQSTGLSQVRIEPNLISPESDPSARLTVGQDITNALQLIYSMNLTDSNDQIWIANYQLLRRLNTRMTKQADNTYRFDFQHDVRFGQKQTTRTVAAVKTIGKVEVTGDLRLPRKTVMDKLGIESGDRYNFLDVRDGMDQLESEYRNQGYLEARLHMNRETTGDKVDIALAIDAGPQVSFAFENYSPSGGLRRRIREVWNTGVFDAQRADDSIEEMRRDLTDRGYLQPELEYRISMQDPQRKLVLFEVQPSTRYTETTLAFEGAQTISPKTLEQTLRDAGVRAKLHTDPAAASEVLTAYYRQQGYVDAVVEPPATEFDPAMRRATTRIGITEGPAYQWGTFDAQGSKVFTVDELRTLSGLRPGMPYTPADAELLRDKIEEAYWDKGYRDVLIDYQLKRQTAQAKMDLVAMVTDGPRSVVENIQVSGADRTSEGFVQKQLTLEKGDALSFTKTAESRRHLYSTGAYSSIDLRVEPIAAAQGDALPGIKRVNLLAQVQERTPFQVRYGAFYDTDRGAGFLADFWNRNSLGGGRVVGVRTRYDSQIREVRGFFSQSLLRNLPLRSDTTVFMRRELQGLFTTDRIGASVQQEFQMKNKVLLTYGYRIERAHTFDNEPDAFFPFDEFLRIARLRSTISRDSRDVLLDATRGSFTSHSFEFAAAKLGSAATFARYFGQYFHYLPLSRPRPVPFGGGVEKPRVIYAGGIRLGLAGGLGGQEVFPSERFFAGGGTTMRGFQQGTLGPLEVVTDKPSGGNAVLVINNELRFPLYRFIDGVGFVDIGNVYPKIADLRLRDLRTSAGTGIRVRTPYLLFRLDYGFKLDRQQNESRGAFFFSIGQAF